MESFLVQPLLMRVCLVHIYRRPLKKIRTSIDARLFDHSVVFVSYIIQRVYLHVDGGSLFLCVLQQKKIYFYNTPFCFFKYTIRVGAWHFLSLLELLKAVGIACDAALRIPN